LIAPRNRNRDRFFDDGARLQGFQPAAPGGCEHSSAISRRRSRELRIMPFTIYTLAGSYLGATARVHRDEASAASGTLWEPYFHRFDGIIGVLLALGAVRNL